MKTQRLRRFLKPVLAAGVVAATLAGAVALRGNSASAEPVTVEASNHAETDAAGTMSMKAEAPQMVSGSHSYPVT
ncbi:hypothetical protein, partial [Salinispira pacifica]